MQEQDTIVLELFKLVLVIVLQLHTWCLALLKLEKSVLYSPQKKTKTSAIKKTPQIALKYPIPLKRLMEEICAIRELTPAGQS